MGYMRQHSDAGHVRAVTSVVGEPGRFSIRLTQGNETSYWSHWGPHHYPSRDLAFAAADALAHHRLGGHECSIECSEWVEPS